MMVRHLAATSLLVGLALVTFLGCCTATRRPPSRHESTQVTPSEPTITDGGWRPVIDSRSSYEPSPHEDGDQTIDLVPPPVGGVKTRTGVKPLGRKPEIHTHKHESHSHKHEPHFHKHESHVHSHEPHVHKHETHHHKYESHVHKPVSLKGVSADLKVSETRGPTSSTQIDGPTGPARPMRFPDQKTRSPAPARPRRPPMVHHHHHHHQPDKHQNIQSQSDQIQNFNVRQNAFVGSESTQQLRFRPSPQVPAAYENPYPGWLVQQDELQSQQQQQQVYYNNDATGLLQLQQSYSSPNAQYQLAIAQQQPELASQFQQSDITAQFKQPQQPIPTIPAQNAFIPGTATVFGNAGLFNVNPDLQKEQGNLFLAPSASEPSIHENEVPQGPQVFVSQTRGRPQRPTLFESNIDIQKLPADPTVPTLQHQENSDYRPRRPRPPSGIQAQLEASRRPFTDENASTRPTDATNEKTVQLKLRHPRPPSTEPPSWSHPMLDTTRVRKPRPPQQNEEVSNKRIRRPRPPAQEQSGDVEQQDTRPRRPLRPAVDDQDWKPSTPIPEPPQHLSPQEESEVPAERPRRPRPPPPVQEQVEDDIVRPTFNLRPRRPQPSRAPDEEEEIVTQRIRRPRPTTTTHTLQEESPEAQEDVDDTVNVRPRRPRPPEDEDRPRIRRPRPPLDVTVNRRRPKPPTEDQEHRRPVYQPVEEEEETESDHGKNLPVATRSKHEDINQDYAVVEQQESQDDVAHEPELLFFTEEPTVETLLESTIVPATTTTHAPLPTFPPKRRRPIKPEQHDNIDDSTENYPPQFIKVTSEATTSPSPTTTNPPTTTRSLINSRLRARLNVTRPRFGLGVKERLNRLSALKKTDDDAPSTTAPVAVEEPIRTRPRTRESYRPKLATTQQPEVERTSFKPTFNRARLTNKFSSRYRPTTEQPETTTNSQDATRRASEDIYAAKDRKPFTGLKNRIPEEETLENDVPVTSVSFSVSEVTTDAPAAEELTTTQMTLKEDETTEITTTAFPEESAPSTPAEDFSLARRVTDLTSSATAFKPLSFFSAVPADGKSRSQLSSRFTMATEDPILPLEAFFPTFPSKSSKEVGDHGEDHSS